jgi:hypothetical protein
MNSAQTVPLPYVGDGCTIATEILNQPDLMMIKTGAKLRELTKKKQRLINELANVKSDVRRITNAE